MSTVEKTDLLGTSCAVFSECGNYRYKLSRGWDETLPACAFIMLNPSTADENVNDPTIAKCIQFAKKWGYGSLLVANLFAWRSTNPESMKQVSDPVGPENEFWIAHISLNAGLVICAWGNNGHHLDRSKKTMSFLNGVPSIKQVYALHVNGTGEPAHPLYQPYSRELIPLLAIANGEEV